MLQILKNRRKMDMQVTLQVNGREMTFSEQELSSILEEHFSSKTTKQTTTAKVPQKPSKSHKQMPV